MEISKLNENPIVFFKSTMKTLLNDEQRVLGSVNYGSYSGSNNFEANIAYLNEDGTVMLANDYFYNKGVKSFNPNDGVSVGYMIDNWGPGDQVIYSERPASEEFKTKLKSIDYKTAGYSRESLENEIEDMMSKAWESENDAGILEIGKKLAYLYIQSRFGDPLKSKEYNHSWTHQIPFKGEDEDLRQLFTLKDGSVVSKVKILDSEEGGMKIELETETEKELPFDALTKEGVQEMSDFLIEQSFYGATV
jgi:hypothetical protein